MSLRPARASLGPSALLAAGFLVLAFGVGADLVRGGTPDFGMQQSALVFLGLLVLAEGALRLAGRPFPALASTIASDSRTGVVVAYLLAGVLGGLLLYQFRAYAADDSFITYRFARNLARGAGVVWNVGEPPVEGYSNFLWMLLAAGALRLGLDPLAVSRGAAFLCYGGCLVAVRALALRAGASPRHANLPVLLFAAIPGFAYWAVSGLETLSVVLLTLLYLIALSREADARSVPWRSALTANLLLLSRPDTPILVGLALIPMLRPFDRERRAWLLRLVLIALPVAAVYLAWKWTTFARVFPNTVTAKFHVMAGITLLIGFFAYAFPALAALAASPARGMRMLERQVLLVTIGLAAALLNAATPVGHYYRFFLPVLAPMLATVALTAERWPASPAGHRTGTVVFVLAVLYALAPLYSMVDYANAEARGLRRAHFEVARLLRHHFTPDRLLAASDCGVLPYVSEMRTLDLWGLTDRTIAERGFDADYVLRADPDAIVLHSLHPGVFTGRHEYDREIHARIAGHAGYRLVGEWEFLGYWLWVYSKRPLR